MGWLIFVDILLIIVLALMLSVTVNVHLNDETRIKIKYAGITIFSISPEDEKQRKLKQKKKNKKLKKSADEKENTQTKSDVKAAQSKKTDDTDSKAIKKSSQGKESKKDSGGLMSKLGLSGDIGETIEFAKQLIESASKPIKRLISHIRVNNFCLFITASGEDAAQSALNYGKINWLVHTAIAVLYNTVKLDVKRIDITADFTSGETKYELSCKVKLRLGTAIGCALWLLFRLAKMYLKINSKNENNTAAAKTTKAKPRAEKA